MIGGVSRELATKNVFLACGFTPLHLHTYLTAHLQLAYPKSRVRVATGLFGDLTGNLERIASGVPAAVILEWSDLDPRLGFRGLPGWSAGAAEDILGSVQARLDALARHLSTAARGSALTLALPSTPIAPISFGPDWLAGKLALGVQALVAQWAASISEADGIRILSTDTLALFQGSRFQLKSELEHGFPYSLAYADFLAAKLAASLAEHQPKKGLITDLDDTLWAGILGEVGPDGVRWTLGEGAQVHGLYQQLLASLAESGTLVAVASKNDPEAMEEAFARLALAVKPKQLFPRIASWERKSRSVKAILDSWNVGPQDVVFIDDSAAELEEVAREFPELTCIKFNGADPQYCYQMLLSLRGLFGKTRLQAEDAIRLSSVRNAVIMREQRDSATSEEEFLAGLGATIAFRLETEFSAGRALDLINKTNQFNLNGRRYQLAEWQALGAQRDRWLVVVEYVDKHGNLGRVSALSGVRKGDVLRVDTWVMSCRAFSRRIEYAVLEFLFLRFRSLRIELAYEPTPRNGPFREFLLHVDEAVGVGPVTLDKGIYDGSRLPRFLGTTQSP
jgi:FkbH-like protein